MNKKKLSVLEKSLMKRKLILFSVPSKDFYVTKSHLYFWLNFHVVGQVWEQALQLFLYRTVADVGLKKFNDFSWKIKFFRFATHLTLFRLCLFRAAQGWEGDAVLFILWLPKKRVLNLPMDMTISFASSF